MDIVIKKRKARRKGKLRLPFRQFNKLPLCKNHSFGNLFEYGSTYVIKKCEICTFIIYKDEIKYEPRPRIVRGIINTEHITMFNF